LTVILVVTPWFYSWYVIWLVALLPLLFAFPMGRIGRALTAFVLMFSLTAFAIYFHLYFMYLPNIAILLRYLLIIIPVIVVTSLIYFFAYSPSKSKRNDPRTTLVEEAVAPQEIY
jgi:hypothetical protein